MNNSELLIQDLMDLLHISHERVNEYNKAAYNCGNLQLKMLLNKEVDQTRDSISAVKHLLLERFGIINEFETKGQLFSLWNEFKPSLYARDLNTQLLDFEMADLLTLQCYCLVIKRSYVNSISKGVLEFQYQSNLLCYYTMKAFRKSYRKPNQVMFYPALQSA